MKQIIVSSTRRRPDWLRRTARATINDDGLHLFPLFHYRGGMGLS